MPTHRQDICRCSDDGERGVIIGTLEALGDTYALSGTSFQTAFTKNLGNLWRLWAEVMSIWDTLFIFLERLQFVLTLCRMLSVLWLTPHTVWTVAVVTQHTRDMPSPLLLQERIRELCAKALRASDPECEKVFRELRKLLHEHSDALRKLAAEKLGGASDSR